MEYTLVTVHEFAKRIDKREQQVQAMISKSAAGMGGIPKNLWTVKKTGTKEQRFIKLEPALEWWKARKAERIAKNPQVAILKEIADAFREDGLEDLAKALEKHINKKYIE